MTGDCHGHAIDLGGRVVANITCALVGVERLDLVVDTDGGDRWFNRDQHLAAIVAGNEAQGLEVDQQGVGLDQEGFVDVAAIIVEHRQLRLDEMAAVQYQVAGDGLHAVGTQVTHQQPEFFHVQLGVTAALEVQVALQNAVVQCAIGVELGFPLVGGAKHFQCRVSSDQLHRRSRVDRYIRVEHCGRARAVERQHDQRQGRILQFAGLEGLLYLGWQAGIEWCGVGRQRQWQHQAGEEQGA
ncbi:hypothetical protein D3C80_1364500 [compost metagenome]